MGSIPKETVPSPVPRSEGGPPGRAPKEQEPLARNVALLISVLVHGFALMMIGLSALLAPHRPSAVPVFELVNLDPPKLRPLTPKVEKPPEPPPPEPEPAPPPEAPKLTPKPTDAVQPKKIEPKVTKPREPEDKTPPKDVVPEQQVLENKAVLSVPQDPRLSMWISRLQRNVDVAWRAPSGVDVAGDVTFKISFTVGRDGTILSQAVAESSGNSELDQLGLMVFQRVGNVAPLPENWPGDQLEAISILTYHGH